MRTRTRITFLLLSLAAAACEDSDSNSGYDAALSPIVDAAPVIPNTTFDAATPPASGALPDAGVQDARVVVPDASLLADASAIADASALADSSSPDGATSAKLIHAIAGGSVIALPDAGAAGANAKGAALLVRTLAGHGLVSLQVSGLGPSKMYPTHVHVAPCATGAGGHYMFDPDAGADAGQSNEIWPTLITDDAGQARAFVDVPMVLRDDAKAIVVHDPDAGSAKMLCADLTPKSPYTTSGSAVAISGADAGVNVSATGAMTRGEDGKTTVRVEIQTLLPSTMYMIHVHDQPCAAANGGGHYKLDYAMTAAVESNEIWLNLTTDALGKADKTVVVDHIARAEAQAIVIHAMDNTRLACIDLKM